MVNKLLPIIRDIFLCYILLLLVRIAVDDTTTYFLNHQQSVIHELDRTFLDHLYTAQRQLHMLEQYPQSIDKAEIIAQLKHKISIIEEQYKKNSPGLALLGPIGTTAIVTKEEQLQKKLLVAVNDMGNILHSLTQEPGEFVSETTIGNGLQKNKVLIKQIIS